MSRCSGGRLCTGVRTKRYSNDWVIATRFFTSGPVKVRRGVERFKTDDVAVAAPKSRKQILNREMIFVQAASFRFDAGDGAREPSVLGIVGIRDYLHGRDYVDGQVHGFGASRRIGDVRRIHQPSTLCRARALHIDSPVRTPDHSGDEG